MVKDIDALSREKIVKDLDHNFFVEASAGSGKTTSLVNRMVALVENGVPIDKICTITFTKAAADEFYARFQSLLSIRSINVADDTDAILGPKSEESIQRCQEALANIDLCFMGTIDAFTGMVSHEMPNEIGIPSDATIISKEEKTLLIEKQYDKILSDKSNELHKYALTLERAIYSFKETFLAGVSLMIDNRDAVVDYDKALVNPDETYFQKEKDGFIDLVKQMSGLSLDFCLKDTKAINIERNQYFNKIDRYYKVYLKHKRAVSDDLAFYKKLVNLIKRVPGGKLPSIIEPTSLVFNGIFVKEKNSYVFSEEAKQIIDNFNNKINRCMHSIFFELISRTYMDVNKSLKQQGKFDYSDFLYAVYEAFKKSSATDRELVDHIFDRHSYFLLDESQDTNPIQTKLFFYLTGTEKNEDWKKVNPKEGSLFIVGDPKQSIYSFRNADVEAFKETKQLFEDKGEVLNLTRNFRSNVSIKDWLNKSMDILLNKGDYPLNHSDIEISDKERNDYLDATIDGDDIILDGEYKYTIALEEEPLALAKFIHTLISDKKYKIKCKNPDKSSSKKYIYRNIDYKDFLLVPRKKDVAKYIYQLVDYQIPLVVEGEIPFDFSRSLIALTDIVQLMKEPGEKPFFIKVVSGEIFHLTDSDINTMLIQGFNFDISDISNLTISDSKCLSVIKELNRLYIETRNMSFSSTMVYILNDQRLSLLTKVNSDFFEYTYFLIEKVREKEEVGQLSGISQFHDFVNKFIEKGNDDDRVLRLKNNTNRVKIANLHKVKGLQAPIVILINPKSSSKDKNDFVSNIDGQRVLQVEAISVKHDGGHHLETIRTDRYDAYIDKWNNYSKAEEDRIKYVGATRPESVLIVSNASKLKSNECSPWGELYNLIDDEKIIEFPSDVIKPEEDRLDINYIDPDINESCNNISIHYHSPSDISKDYKIAVKNNNEDEIIENKNKEDATLVGTMVHKLLECVVSSYNYDIKRSELIKSIIKEYGKDNKYEQLLAQVLDKLYHGGFQQINSSLDDDILNTLESADDVLCEVPFSYKDGDTVVQGIIDLLYQDDSGYHIIDYKTNKEKDVSILEKEYRSQLQDYIKALRHLGIEADAHIYHIDV